ncbi:hypothetical protein HMPREF1508_1488 [Shuttleworthella sp. MSX8B]|nr:hypothetical protein HMPREF1508_1488 [Shuttleworthia sp. MSX8B]
MAGPVDSMSKARLGEVHPGSSGTGSADRRLDPLDGICEMAGVPGEEK